MTYATANGTAVAGSDYTATGGTLSWAAGDTAGKSFSVAISNTTPFSGSKNFTIKLSSPAGGAPLGTSTGTVTINGSGASTAALSVRVKAGHFVDAQGNTVQLRGANVSGLEFVPIQGWSPGNPWGAQTGDETPNWNMIKTWKTSVVRLPLNEASWLGYSCVDGAGKIHDPDPGHNYQATVLKSVQDATAAGLYIILDLHWTAPNDPARAVSGVSAMCPMSQNPFADADHSVDFWTSLANTFKSYPNVIFDLFNEPFFWWLSPGADPWQIMQQGGTILSYNTGDGGNYQINHSWQSVGTQQLINVIRATGATNVLMIPGVDWCQDMQGWLAARPTDPLNQLAASWHGYPGSDNTTPTDGNVQYTYVQQIVAAGFPVVIGETGGNNGPGVVGWPLGTVQLPWADQYGISVVGWTWDNWGGTPVLIQDPQGTPTQGFGTVFHEWMVNHP